MCKFKVTVSGVLESHAVRIINKLLGSDPEPLKFSEPPHYRGGDVVAEVDYPEITNTLVALKNVKDVFGLDPDYSPSVGQPIFV